jgi:hypothetical protein
MMSVFTPATLCGKQGRTVLLGYCLCDFLSWMAIHFFLHKIWLLFYLDPAEAVKEMHTCIAHLKAI